MTGPVIALDQWPDEFRGDNAKLISCISALLSMDAAGALVPHGIGGHARSLLAASANRIAMLTPQPAIDLEQLLTLAMSWEARISPMPGCRTTAGAIGALEDCAAELLALIDGQANVRSSSEHSDSLTPVARKKLQGLQAEGFIVNGVAIFNPATGQRGLVDYLGYVGWQTSEQPSKGEGE